MYSNMSYNSVGFKVNCSGRGCARKPKKLLRIKYIKKIGKFCEVCAADLFEADLVEEELKSERNSGKSL